ncbi:phosphate acetyltransferase [Granulosicoccus antarcticus]|uniref:Phosphate acetyltransferase n=1 Tax=Granulosicoccus antarcticus IMCC3135 TaxID=1192854 RepID=A0A2Z2NUA1_9GAMM|nr:phosphate acetyltransferase [Granulosicoccus antarcticus]ASJ74075.1 Ethanolamine utilization protein EutD [Granulosicoccus antarcticus IMCC3135]
MSILESIMSRARGLNQRIVLSEGEDPRIVEGAVRAFNEGLAQPVLVGKAGQVEPLLKQFGGSSESIEIIDPANSQLTPDYAAAYHALRAHKGVDAAMALEAVTGNPLVFAAMMVREGQADATIGGAIHTTGDTVRAALQVIGRAKGVSTVSSFFLMFLEQEHHGTPRVLVFADCALVIQPSVEELAQIAVSSATSFEALSGETARVAMLSFSTAGSAKHPLVTHVIEATDRARELAPELMIDGEFQFDAAFVPDIAAHKAPDSKLAGNANIMVFPDLAAGNIGYKIAQRIGGAIAIGPILQGLAKPANDLSRGCNADDVYKLIAVTAVQAGAGVAP